MAMHSATSGWSSKRVRCWMRCALAELAGLEDLLDGGEQAVGVGAHDGVELLALGLVAGMALEGFEVEPDAGDGCL